MYRLRGCEPKCPVDAIKPDTEPGLEIAYSPRAIGAGISDDSAAPWHPLPMLAAHSSPERSQSCAAQVVGEVVADTSDGE